MSVGRLALACQYASSILLRAGEGRRRNCRCELASSAKPAERCCPLDGSISHPISVANSYLPYRIRLTPGLAVQVQAIGTALA